MKMENNDINTRNKELTAQVVEIRAEKAKIEGEVGQLNDT
jgi:hypothetical protein